MEQKIKNYLGIAGIIGILVVAVAGWRYVGAYANSLQPGSYRSFGVSAEGTTVVIPDIATFNFSVITEGGKDLAPLQTKNTESVNKAIAYLKANGVDAKDIKTQSYSVDPRYQYSNCGLVSSTCPPPTIVGYTITQNVSVKVRDIGKSGDILSGVVLNGANNVSGLQFTLDNSDAAKSSARAEAIDKAKAKAEELARQGGFGIGRLVSISVNDGDTGPVYYGAYGMGGSGAMEKGAPAPTVEPGSKEIKVTVFLTYEII